MILDTLPQWHRYAGVLPGFAQACKYLQTLTPNTATGRYELDGDRMYCLVQQYQTKPVTQAKFEAHRNYVDIQYLLAGRETILWAPLAILTTVTQPYDTGRDVEFFATVTNTTPINLKAGQFCLLFPTDGHAPGVECNGALDVVKAVVKVRLPNGR